jgi:hypothetical protein
MRGNMPTKCLARVRQPLRALGLATVLVLLAVGVAAPAVSATGRSTRHPPAVAARTISINESATLKIVHQEYHKVEATGRTTGTFNAPMILHYSIDTGERSSSSFISSPSGGKIYGGANSTYRVSGADSYFQGTVTINGGSGTYKDAYGTNIHITGTLERWRLELIIHITGTMRV